MKIIGKILSAGIKYTSQVMRKYVHIKIIMYWLNYWLNYYGNLNLSIKDGLRMYQKLKTEIVGLLYISITLCLLITQRIFVFKFSNPSCRKFMHTYVYIHMYICIFYIYIILTIPIAYIYIYKYVLEIYNMYIYIYIYIYIYVCVCIYTYIPDL